MDLTFCTVKLSVVLPLLRMSIMSVAAIAMLAVFVGILLFLFGQQKKPFVIALSSIRSSAW